MIIQSCPALCPCSGSVGVAFSELAKSFRTDQCPAKERRSQTVQTFVLHSTIRPYSIGSGETLTPATSGTSAHIEQFSSTTAKCSTRPLVCSARRGLRTKCQRFHHNRFFFQTEISSVNLVRDHNDSPAVVHGVVVSSAEEAAFPFAVGKAHPASLLETSQLRSNRLRADGNFPRTQSLLRTEPKLPVNDAEPSKERGWRIFRRVLLSRVLQLSAWSRG